MCARGAGSSTSSLDQQREIPPLSRASGRIATPPFTPVLSESHQVNHRHAASERRRNRTCTPAFTPVLGPSDGARFVDAELDMGMMRSVRRVKRDSPDFIALRISDEDSHEDNEAINIESIIHAEAMRRCRRMMRIAQMTMNPKPNLTSRMMMTRVHIIAISAMVMVIRKRCWQET